MSKKEKLYTQGDIEELNKTIIDNNCEIILKDQRIAELEKQLAIREIAFLNEIPYWDYYSDCERFETDKERQLYIKKKLEQAEKELKGDK